MKELLMKHDLHRRIIFSAATTLALTLASSGAAQSLDATESEALNEEEQSLEDEFSADQGTMFSTEMDNYTNHPKTRAMIKYGKDHAGPSQGLCLRGVKKAMTYGGEFFTSYPGVAWAVKFGPEMRRVHFSDIYARSSYRTSINESMENVPLGCVVVYKGVNLNADRNAKYGHIEIRTPGGFVSDFFASHPRTGSWTRTEGHNRRVTGVYCKI
jgi:hypothetical protein